MCGGNMWEILVDGINGIFILKHNGSYYELRASNYVAAKIESENFIKKLELENV